MAVTARRDPQVALARMRQRAKLDLVASFLILCAFAVAWRLAHLSAWFVVFGILFVVQSLGYAVFVKRQGADVNFWRRKWLQLMIASIIWSAAVDVVAEQISFVFGAVLTAFTCLWIGGVLLVWVRLRRKHSAI